MTKEIRQKIEVDIFKKLFSEDFLITQPLELIKQRRFLENTIKKLIKKNKLALNSKDQEIIIQAIIDRLKGFGPLQKLIYHPEITEIMVNGPKKIFIERHGKLELTDIEFIDEQDLRQTINRIVSAVGRRIDEANPMVDARLPNGSRVHAIIPPLSLNGPVLTIRKFSKDPFTLEKLIQNKTLTLEMAEFLKQTIINKKNILIIGGTGSGKTSTLNALSKVIPQNERLISIEDSAELQLGHQNLVSLESRPPNLEGEGEITIRTLLRNALRMRPNRIIIGEVRGKEALDMLQAMNTGHQGSLTTIHANAPLEGLLRLETLIMSAAEDIPLSSIREQIWRAIDLIVFQERLGTGLRRITNISEVVKEPPSSTQSYLLKNVFSN